MSKLLVILEDDPYRMRAMTGCLEADDDLAIELFESSAAIIEFLERSLEEADCISLDHDLELVPNDEGGFTDRGTGREVAEYLATRQPVCPVVLHSSNALAVAGMELVLGDAGWQTVRVVPFADLAWIKGAWVTAIRDALRK